MKKIINPQYSEWCNLMKRPEIAAQRLDTLVDSVFNDVQINGDEAVQRYNNLYDDNNNIIKAIDTNLIENSGYSLSDDLKNAIELAAVNITKFHASQRETVVKITTIEGVTCWRESRPIETVGLYIPGGSAPLFSTVLMLGIPAKLAGCKRIVLCTPARHDEPVNPAILFAAKTVGITEIYAAGGIQAIAAMTFGTGTVPKADKIFGPGNQYVSAAKQKAQQLGTAIDIPAGPSEVLIIADEGCSPDFIAADLLSQAEHGADSQVILLSNNETIIDSCLEELKSQLEALPRKDIASVSLENSYAVVLSDIDACIDFSNQYAPEHLILALKDASSFTDKILNAGSVFIGNYSCESAGDYASGTNHTLPTNGHTRSYSGVSLDSFIKKITFQELSAQGIQNLGPAIEIMAEAEQLWAHKNAVTIRLKTLKNV